MNTSETISVRLSAAVLLLSLTACSPHPATGNWTTAIDPDNGFNRLDITFEGHALLFEAGEKEAGRRCFWAGESAQAIAMTCKPAFDTSIEERYRLTIDTDDTATLMRDGRMAARFSRQPR